MAQSDPRENVFQSEDGATPKNGESSLLANRKSNNSANVAAEYGNKCGQLNIVNPPLGMDNSKNKWPGIHYYEIGEPSDFSDNQHDSDNSSDFERN